MDDPQPSDPRTSPAWVWEHDIAEVLRAAFPRIRRDRKRMTVEDAEDIIRMEARQRGVSIQAVFVEQFAYSFHMSRWERFRWLVLRHPRKPPPSSRPRPDTTP